jgi:hypothetical protein
VNSTAVSATPATTKFMLFSYYFFRNNNKCYHLIIHPSRQPTHRLVFPLSPLHLVNFHFPLSPLHLVNFHFPLSSLHLVNFHFPFYLRIRRKMLANGRWPNHRRHTVVRSSPRPALQSVHRRCRADDETYRYTYKSATVCKYASTRAQILETFHTSKVKNRSLSRITSAPTHKAVKAQTHLNPKSIAESGPPPGDACPKRGWLSSYPIPNSSILSWTGASVDPSTRALWWLPGLTDQWSRVHAWQPQESMSWID